MIKDKALAEYLVERGDEDKRIGRIVGMNSVKALIE